MKTSLLYATTALCLFLSSCIKEGNQEDGTLNLSLCVSGGDPGTKAQIAAERTIHSSTIFIFDKTSGNLERVVSSSVSGDGSVSVNESVKSGTKTIFAYANTQVSIADGNTIGAHPMPGEGLPENDFDSQSFQMIGSGEVMITRGSTVSASISLSRKVSRVVIKSIRNSLPGSLALEILGAYLADVYMGDTPGSVSPSPSRWANKWGRGADYSIGSSLEYEDLTSWFPSAFTIANGTSMELSLPSSSKGPRFYCMPNPLASESLSGPYISGDQWSPRLTKLVIVARISGALCYYSIPLESPSANESAEYSITVFGVGSDDPEITSDTGSYGVNRIIKDWEGGADYIDNSTPQYKMGVISSSAGHTSVSHIAQRLYLQMPVAEMEPEVRSGITFRASLAAPDGVVTDVSDWISPSYSSGNMLWELNIECRAEGQLEVRAFYNGDMLARAVRSIFAPLLSAYVEPLLITGEANSISLSWSTADGASSIVLGNTVNETDGAFFDSGLYSSLLADGSLEFDTAWGGRSMLGTYVTGGNRYLRVQSLGGMEEIIRYANEDDSFSSRSRPLLARFRIVTPCGVKSSWADARICNWWANFYDGGSVSEFIYRDNDCFDKNVEIAGIIDNMSYSAPEWKWEWTGRWGYTFGCGNSIPMSGAGSRVGISAGKVRINNASSARKTNAAGLSQISASFTNSVSGEKLSFPCMDVYIYKTFFFRSTVNSAWDIIYSAPDVSAFAADIPLSPVEKPLWSEEALERGAGYSAANVKPAYRTNTTEASQLFSSAESYTRSSYSSGPEDKKHSLHFYSFEPAYENGYYRSF